MRESPHFKAKVGDTKREISAQFLQDDIALDEEPSSVTVNLVHGLASVTRSMTFVEERWIYRPIADDYSALGVGIWDYDFTLTWADGEATCPTVGHYTLPVSAPL